MTDKRSEFRPTEENVVIQSGACSLTLLPAIWRQNQLPSASMVVELLQAPLAPLAPRTRTMPFDAGDASGWDECLPSVAACTVHTATGPAKFPTTAISGASPGSHDRPHLHAARQNASPCPSRSNAQLSSTKPPSGWQLRLNYKLTNTGGIPFPGPGPRILSLRSMPGDIVVLPRIDRTPCASKALPAIASARPATPSRGRIARSRATAAPHRPQRRAAAAFRHWRQALRRASRPRRQLVRAASSPRRPAHRIGFNAAATPYLGLWLCYGGWPDRPGPKQIALHSSQQPHPSIRCAQSGPWSRMLAPARSASWPDVLWISKSI